MAEQLVKLKKKQWYPILAPKMFNNVVIGETLVAEPSSMLNKTLSHSLMNLVNDVKRQNVNIHFKVNEVDNGKAKSIITGYELINSSVKRMVRRGSEKIDMSFNCETADNVFLRVKPVAVTRSAVKGTVAAKLRHNISRILTGAIKKLTYEQVLNDLITYKLQSYMRENLNKIYPLKICEIRYLGIEAREGKQPQEATQETKEEVKEESREITEEPKEEIEAEVQEEN